jgi:hypothetical protein
VEVLPESAIQNAEGLRNYLLLNEEGEELSEEERQQRLQNALAFARTTTERADRRVNVAYNIRDYLSAERAECEREIQERTERRENADSTRERRRELMEKIAEANAAIEALKPKEEKKPEEKKGGEEESFGVKMKDWVKEHPKESIAIATTATVGLATIAYLIYRWRKKWRTASPQQGPQEQGGRVPGWVYLVPGVGLAVVAAYAGHKLLMKVDTYAKWLQGTYQWGKTQIPFVGRSEAEKKAEQYGLDEDRYKQAVEAYKIWDLKRVREIFGLVDGAESPEHQRFKHDMDERYEEIDVHGLKYKHSEAAFEAYENDVANVVGSVERWVRQNQYKLVIAGGVVSAKAGILSLASTIGKVGVSVAEKALATGMSLGEFATNHPVVALLMFGGTVLVMRQALSGKGGYLLPKDLSTFKRALSNAAPLPYPQDTSVITAERIQELNELATSVPDIRSDMVTWTEKELEKILPELDEAVADWLRLSERQLLAERHELCFKELKKTLESKKGKLKESKEAREAGHAKNCDDALKILEDYEMHYTAFLLQGDEDEEKNDTRVTADDVRKKFGELQDAFQREGVNIHIEVRNGIIWWRDRDDANMEEPWSLSVHPDIEDPKEIEAKSRELYHSANGNAPGSLLCNLTPSHLRQCLQDARCSWGETSK